MYYQVPKLAVKLDGADKFLKAMGAEKTEFLSKFSVKERLTARRDESGGVEIGIKV